MTAASIEKQSDNAEAEERKLPSASIVFETIRKEGAEEIERTAPVVASSRSESRRNVDRSDADRSRWGL